MQCVRNCQPQLPSFGAEVPYFQTYLLLSLCDCQSQQNEEMTFSKSELVGKNTANIVEFEQGRKAPMVRASSKDYNRLRKKGFSRQPQL